MSLDRVVKVFYYVDLFRELKKKKSRDFFNAVNYTSRRRRKNNNHRRGTGLVCFLRGGAPARGRTDSFVGSFSFYASL